MRMCRLWFVIAFACIFHIRGSALQFQFLGLHRPDSAGIASFCCIPRPYTTAWSHSAIRPHLSCHSLGVPYLPDDKDDIDFSTGYESPSSEDLDVKILHLESELEEIDRDNKNQRTTAMERKLVVSELGRLKEKQGRLKAEQGRLKEKQGRLDAEAKLEKVMGPNQQQQSYFPSKGPAGGGNQGPYNPDDLAHTIATARGLLVSRYYDPIFEAVILCSQSEPTFIVIDCPSGTGKSLAGIALRELDHSRIDSLKTLYPAHHFRVAHIVWPGAVGAQPIYKALHDLQIKEGVFVNTFYERAKILAAEVLKIPQIRTSQEFQAYIWDNFLQYLFVAAPMAPFVWEQFASEHGLLNCIFVLFLDEIPTNPVDVELVGFIRDLLRFLPNVVLILAGTNSKASNMLGLLKAEASSNALNDVYQKWALLITRLPAYDPNSSAYFRMWKWCQVASQSRPALADIVAIIHISIRMGGNARLINMAIRILRETAESSSRDIFEYWQNQLTLTLAANKFSFVRWTEMFEFLVCQTNFCLAATSDYQFADTVLQKHLAFRAVPTRGPPFAFGPASRVESCCGWLHIANDKARALDNQLFYKTIAPVTRSQSAVRSQMASYDWQVTLFPAFDIDPLLYFACCFSKGFFSLPSKCGFPAWRVAEALWAHNSVGRINHRNVNVNKANSGSFLEVAVALAIINAAAVQSEVRVDMWSYLAALINQLCVNSKTASSEFQKDTAFSGLSVPRFIFPGTRTKSAPAISSNLFGLLERTADSTNIDAILSCQFGDNILGRSLEYIRFEDKNREALDNPEILKIIRKLIRVDGDIGVIVVLECSDFWKKKQANLRKITDGLRSQGLVGRAYFIRRDGCLQTLTMSAAPGRVIVIQVDRSWTHSTALRETYEFDSF